jgi:transcriptional regulator with XRE-family HTH domain
MHPVRIYRRARGLTLKTLAAEVGTTYQAAQAWEQGTMPRPVVFRKLAERLDVDPLQLQREINEWERGSAARSGGARPRSRSA